jgi:hypothetical protein
VYGNSTIEQELLEMVTEPFFEFGLGKRRRFGDLEELEDVRLTEQIGWLFDLSLFSVWGQLAGVFSIHHNFASHRHLLDHSSICAAS